MEVPGVYLLFCIAFFNILIIAFLSHGHQSSSFIVKCNDTKFMKGTSYNAEAGLDSYHFISACLYTFSTWKEHSFHVLEDFGVTIQGQDYLLFEVMACNDAYLLLMTDRHNFVEDVYEIGLGVLNNSRTHIIRKGDSSSEVYKNHEPLNCSNMEQFWLSWENETVQVGIGHQIGQDTFITLNDSVPTMKNYLAVSTGFGATGYWIIHNAYPGCCLYEPRDCDDVRQSGSIESGVYSVTPEGTYTSFDVYCDMTPDNESWLVFQRRLDGSVDFYLGWNNYTLGFGDLNGEFWLGNEFLSRLLAQGQYELKVELEDFSGNTRYARYTTFDVRDRTSNFKLTVGGYSGDAGNSMQFQNGRGFSTKDKDNDGSSDNCAILYHGAWWYGGCHHSNLNGKYLNGSHSSYANGVNWRSWKGYNYSLKTTQMKIRRKQN